MLGLLAYAGLRPQEALALRWGDVRERTLLVEKAADGQGGVKTTKTGQARTVRLLAPLTCDLAEWRHLLDQSDDDALVPERLWRRLERPRLADVASGRLGTRLPRSGHGRCAALRPSPQLRLVLIHEGRSVVEVARQAGHSATMTLDVYAHVFDEFDIAERVSAEDQIAQARRDVSGLCPPGSEGAVESQETPANPYNPICLPRISFMSPEHGTGGHAGSSEGEDSPQMSLFEEGSNDRE